MSVLNQQNTESTVIAENTDASVNCGDGNKTQVRISAQAFDSLPLVRQKKILEIRQQITEGKYDLDKRFNIAFDRLLEDLSAKDRIIRPEQAGGDFCLLSYFAYFICHPLPSFQNMLFIGEHGLGPPKIAFTLPSPMATTMATDICIIAQKTFNIVYLENKLPTSIFNARYKPGGTLI